jgi:hypothetical protein
MQQFRHLLIKMTGCLQRVIKGLLNLVESKPYQPGPPKQQNVSVLGGLLVPVSTWSPSWSKWGVALSKPAEVVGNRCNYRVWYMHMILSLYIFYHSIYLSNYLTY